MDIEKLCEQTFPFEYMPKWMAENNKDREAYIAFVSNELRLAIAKGYLVIETTVNGKEYTHECVFANVEDDGTVTHRFHVDGEQKEEWVSPIQCIKLDAFMMLRKYTKRTPHYTGDGNGVWDELPIPKEPSYLDGRDKDVWAKIMEDIEKQ